MDFTDFDLLQGSSPLKMHSDFTFPSPPHKKGSPLSTFTVIEQPLACEKEDELVGEHKESQLDEPTEEYIETAPSSLYTSAPPSPATLKSRLPQPKIRKPNTTTIQF